MSMRDASVHVHGVHVHDPRVAKIVSLPPLLTTIYMTKVQAQMCHDSNLQSRVRLGASHRTSLESLHATTVAVRLRGADEGVLRV